MNLEKWNKQTPEVKQIILDLAISFGHKHYSSLEGVDYKFWEDVQPEDIALDLAEMLAKKTKEVHELHIRLAESESSLGNHSFFNRSINNASIKENTIVKNHAIEFLESIRDYEREGRSLIGFDERTSEELYNIFINPPEKENKVTKEDLAKILNGREYGNEITKEEELLAKENGLVVVFGHSDDCIEFRGAMNDEFGQSVNFTKDGEIRHCDDDCPYFTKALNESSKIFRKPSKTTEHYWVFETIIPHAEFDVFEDGDLYGKGLVFDIESLK